MGAVGRERLRRRAALALARRGDENLHRPRRRRPDGRAAAERADVIGGAFDVRFAAGQDDAERDDQTEAADAEEIVSRIAQSRGHRVELP